MYNSSSYFHLEFPTSENKLNSCYWQTTSPAIPKCTPISNFLLICFLRKEKSSQTRVTIHTIWIIHHHQKSGFFPIFLILSKSKKWEKLLFRKKKKNKNNKIIFVSTNRKKKIHSLTSTSEFCEESNIFIFTKILLISF